MSEAVIKVEDLSKQYRLGMVGAGTLREDIVGLWHRMRGKQDPYLNVGEANDRSTAGTSDYVWALRDVNFEVNQGEVLGIIGKNGAGKSTLLKLLSRVTAPTTGTIKAKGRIASLLEVGTGFHPELTGKENIYLNGAIMGMRRAEITSKLDEIIDFAGVQRYVDTPVKRYSSGMYVRLAFAVAAHLEPEILIVDEVLAVGDAEFQKKALGKMQDVSTGMGRTVLFVSHNMKAVKSLCPRSILLEKGTVKADGETSLVIDSYLLSTGLGFERLKFTSTDILQSPSVTVEGGKILNALPIKTTQPIQFEFHVTSNEEIEFHFNLHLFTDEKDVLFIVSSKSVFAKPGNRYVVTYIIPQHLLNERNYRVKISIVRDRAFTFHEIDNVLSFSVVEVQNDLNWYGRTPGLIKPEVENSISQL